MTYSKQGKMAKRQSFLYIAFLVVIAVLLWKSFPFFQEPRLWAEEATVYLKAALEEGSISMLMPQLGYYSMIPSTVTYLSTWFLLPYIPVFTQSISLSFWILLFALILGINRKEYDVWIKVSFLFSILFILLSQTEVFLNTINLQFVTPIIFLITLLYDENKLKKRQIIGIRILQFICLLNGVLAILLLPYVLYKSFLGDKKYDLVILCMVCLGVHMGMSIGYEGKSNMSIRLVKNWQYFIEDYNISPIRVLAHRKPYAVWIILMVVVIWGSLMEKRREEKRREEKRREEKRGWAIILLFNILLLIVFIDFTKLPKHILYYRYLVLIYSLLYFAFIQFFVQKAPRYRVQIPIMLTLIIGYIYRSEIIYETSYCEMCPKWSENYQKIYSEDGGEVHPSSEWILKVDKKTR